MAQKILKDETARMDDYAAQIDIFERDMLTPLNLITQRELGAFYTCPSTAEHMANWAIRSPGMRVLEPSFGSGIFLRAARHVAESQFSNDITLVGAELSPEEHERAKGSILSERDTSFLGDFLQMPTTKVDAVIGNPPYVRLRNLPETQAASAHIAASKVLGHRMETSGSVWMPFVLRCQEFLNLGGRMALVLPFELTYVRYARPLWKSLASSFSKLTVARVRERLFPDILQDVVILYADYFGGSTDTITFSLYEKLTDLTSGAHTSSSRISSEALVRGEREFIRAHLGSELRDLIDLKIRPLTTTLSDQCAFNIGYVSGDKSYFHPTPVTRAEWGLPARSLVDALVSGRAMKGGGLLTSKLSETSIGKLFLPQAKRLTKTEKAYIQHGENNSVHLRYKCQARSPWYVVPGVRVPDLILSVFAERPIMMKNDGGLAATNSLLNGFLKANGSADSLITSWYSSLTLLGCEMQVHSLGGGVFVLIPGEVAKIAIPKSVKPTAEHLRKLHQALSRGDIATAYELGDSYVLRKTMGLSGHELDLIRDGVTRLARWRLRASAI